LFDVCDYTVSSELGQSSVSSEQSGDLASPLAICHNGPLRSVSLFPGVIERDRKEPSRKKSDSRDLEEDEEEKTSRGRVIGLSPRSRLRLQVRINRCVFKPLHCWFITLTYPSDYPPQFVAKAHLRAYLKRLRRRFGKCGLVWRIENQKRGAPHFHIILFLAAAIPLGVLSEWSNQNWYEVVDSGDPRHLLGFGSRVAAFKSVRGLASYCSKYVSKPEEGDRARLIEGRQWGREGDFPEERIDFFFSEKDFFRFWRILRRSKGLIGHVGPGAGHPWRNIFATALHDDWLRLASMFGSTTGEVVKGEFYV
jgi:hypothetical protein